MSGADCSASLNIDGAAKAYVLLAPGAAKSGQTRPSSALADYLDDTANSDAWTAQASGQASFAKPSTASNDALRSRP